MMRPTHWFTRLFACVRDERRIAEQERQELYAAKRTMAVLQEEAVARGRQLQQLAAQLVQLRVSQSTVGRAGWEVMCFIPEEVLQALRGTRLDLDNNPAYRGLVQNCVYQCYEAAIRGIHRIDSQGKVCALVFEPLNTSEPVRAPRYVQALFDKEGKYKLSDRCWDKRTEEQRVKNAAGMGGFGV